MKEIKCLCRQGPGLAALQKKKMPLGVQNKLKIKIDGIMHPIIQNDIIKFNCFYIILKYVYFIDFSNYIYINLLFLELF